MSPAAERPRKDLVAPHKRGRGAAAPRPFEKLAIYGYRAGMWLMGRLPVPVARGIVSFAAPGCRSCCGRRSAAT